jgi:site-specific DNA-methyltransferase (adenine-specific)
MIEIIQAECLQWMKERPSDSVDLIFTSPPYEDARTYGIDFRLKGQAWVDWMVERTIEMVRICKGLVAIVVEGKTRNFQWSATPALLMADLHRAGITLRKPPAFHRVGIPGSGGPDWLRNDYEFIVCCTKGGKLPWSDNTACGEPPQWSPGGPPSHRMQNGRRVHKLHTKADPDGKRVQGYNPPTIANPGNVIRCDVGGSRMGSAFAHENEAPFPEKLAEMFVKSFCPPGGVVLDPFGGSGTCASVAQQHGRNAISLDIRESQCELTARRTGQTLELAG